MAKIILKEITKGNTGWFCDSCKNRIFGVSESISGKPFIDNCPHCGVTFSGYELCKCRLELNAHLASEFPELASVFNQEVKDENSN